MTQALWAARPLPQLRLAESSSWRGTPTTLAELRSMRMQLRSRVSGADRPPGAGEDDVERLLLAFEELVSNALRHAAGPVRAAVTDVAGGWLLQVSDASGDTPPVPAVDRDAALGGLGLYLVARICAAHGWTADGEGRKVVWARVDFTGDRPAPEAVGRATPVALPTTSSVPARPARPAGRERRRSPRAARTSSRGRRLLPRTTPRRLGLGVTAVVLALTLVLAWLASLVNASNNQRLLQQQVAEASTLLTTQVAVIQTQMADAGQVADATAGAPGPFTRFAGATAGGSGMSMSLWRVGEGRAAQLAVHGPAPLLAARQPASFLSRVRPSGQLAVAGILQGPEPRLGYALMPAGATSGLVVYAEVPLVRKVAVPQGGAFSGLDLAVYLGRSTAADQLVQRTAPIPIRGDTATTEVPFGDDVLTVVAAARGGLTGPLSAALPWIVLGGGGVLALGGGATVEILARRRAVAEGLAAENERLYRQQRSIAGTLQHALLPDVPTMADVEIAARYVAGVDELEVGGDWYDVIPGPSGSCVFVVGDISGQGLRAATTMAELRFAVRAYLAQGDDIATVLIRLRALLDIEVDHQFATVLLGELDPAAGLLRVVSAGHFGPLLISGGRAEHVECSVAPPVGVATPVPPKVTELRVSGPTTLLAFTDGAVERRGEVIDTGLERLRSTAVAAQAQPLPGILDRLMPTAAGGRDDTVLLGLRWTS